jgi:predicted permease
MSGSDLRQDLKYTFRNLIRSPSFFFVAVIIVGLGIGATTSIFSVVNAVLLRPLPFHEPERLVWVANTEEGGGRSGVTSRAANLRDWRELNRSFESLTGYFAFYNYSSFTLGGNGDPERLVGVGVAQNFLDVLGVRPHLGRNFVDEECVWNGRAAAILSHGFWQRRYGGDPRIVGTPITLNDRPTTVVGVLPASFDFASIFAPGSKVDFLNPFPIADETDQWGNTLAVIGRLAPGMSAAKAQADLELVNRQLKQADPGRWGLGARVSGLQQQITAGFRRPLLVLACAVGVVLLIVCANLSNLLLARASSRTKEMAVRSALGASRSRLVRQLLTESLVLSGCGAVLGVAVAFGITRALAGTQAFGIPLLQSVAVDGDTLLFALGAALATGLLFGVAPALQVSGAHHHEALADSSRGSSETRARTRTREALVVAEVALACILVVGAGLLLRSFVTLLDVDLGFRPDRVVAWRIETGDRYDRDERRPFFERLLEGVRTVPGVDSVGLTDSLPLGRNRSWAVRAKGEVYDEGELPQAFPRMVSSGYMETMGIRLISGRYFTPRDSEDTELAMIVNETMARRLWPGRDPVGQVAQLGGASDPDPDWHVVGVVADVRHSSLEEEAGPEMYMPMRQQGDWGSPNLVVRARLDPESIVASVRAALRNVDPGLPTAEFQTLGAMVDRAVSPRRLILLLLGYFAAAALGLAAVGIYGVVSYTVSRQTHEIGIRMALGASATDVQTRVVAKTLRLTAIGMLIGSAGSFVVSRLMEPLLYGISATDPTTLVVTVALLALTATLAGYLPALRASRTDPAVVLRAAGSKTASARPRRLSSRFMQDSPCLAVHEAANSQARGRVFCWFRAPTCYGSFDPLESRGASSCPSCVLAAGSR